MSRVCEICAKKRKIGSSQKHKRGVAGKRWKNKTTKTPREFLPNLQMKTVTVGGETKQMKICAKCIKRIKKFGNVKKRSYKIK